ncbi:MAG: hypothetical protein ACTHVY_08845 [Brevibacterium yomogidense]
MFGSKADATDVDGFVLAGEHHPAQTDVDVEALQEAQLRGEPMNLRIALECGLTVGTGALPERVEAAVQFRSLAVEASGDRGEVFVVASNELGDRLRIETVRQVEIRGRGRAE